MLCSPHMVTSARTEKPIYLDYNSTTPVDPRVLATMLPYFTENFGNSSSKTHSYGWDADLAIEEARKKIAASINATPKEIFFTSGGTESNNLALSGVVQYLKENSPSEKIHIISSKTEHKSGLQVLKKLESSGVEVTFLESDKFGRVSLDQVARALKPHTQLVSLIFGSNEIGTLNPIQEIGSYLTAGGILFHTDAAQAYGQIPMDVQRMGIDMMTLSAHKIYGPKGAGALFVRQLPKRVRISPAMIGGGQEKGLRAGTLNVPAIVGFGAAAEIISKELKIHSEKIQALRDELLLEILKIPFAHLNGHPVNRLPNNISITFDGVTNADLLMELRDLAISTGSACSSGSSVPSHVLKAIGLSDEQCLSTLRLSIGRNTTLSEIQHAASRIKNAAIKLRGRQGFQTL